MPDVEYSRVGRTDDLDVALDVFAIEGDVLAAPADYVLVEASNPQEVRPFCFQKECDKRLFNVRR